MQRRTFLRRACGTVVLSGLPLSWACDDGPAPAPAPQSSKQPTLRFFEPSQADTLRAALEVLWPAGPQGGLPGAEQAGVFEYMDARLHAQPRLREPVTRALGRLDSRAAQQGGKPFAALTVERRTQLLQWSQRDGDPRSEGSPAADFVALQQLSLQGYLGAPDHGGNRDGRVWRALGVHPECDHLFEACG